MIGANDLYVKFEDVAGLSSCVNVVSGVVCVSKLMPRTSVCVFEGTGIDERVRVWYFAMGFTFIAYVYAQSNLKSGEQIAVDVKELSKLASALASDKDHADYAVFISKTKDGSVKIKTDADEFDMGTIASDFSPLMEDAIKRCGMKQLTDGFELSSNKLSSAEFVESLSCTFRESATVLGDPSLNIISDLEKNSSRIMVIANTIVTVTNTNYLGFDGVIIPTLFNAITSVPWEEEISIKSNGKALIINDTYSMLISTTEAVTDSRFIEKVNQFDSMFSGKKNLTVSKQALETALKKLNFTSDLELFSFECDAAKGSVTLTAKRGSVALAHETLAIGESFEFAQTLPIIDHVIKLLGKAPKGTLATFDFTDSMARVTYSTATSTFIVYYGGVN